MNADHYTRVMRAFDSYRGVLPTLSASTSQLTGPRFQEAEAICKKAWDKAFEGYTGEPLDLKGADLTGVVFAGARDPNLFESAAFQDAILDKTGWIMIRAHGADFSGATMRESITFGMMCSGAVFRHTNLAHTRLFLIAREPLDFSDANLTEASIGPLLGENAIWNFANAQMSGCRVDFRGNREQLKAFLAALSEEQRSQIEVNRKRSPCFIATAACGSSDAPEVCVLRQFRDSVLCETFVGRALITTYTFTSPPLANLISNSNTLRFLVRKMVVLPSSNIAQRIMARRLKERYSSRTNRRRNYE